jgi:hypothetical protein
MTALATIFALTPMALGITGHGGFISQPLAIVVIGGLISSTVLTLLVLPTLYNLVEGAKERRATRRGMATDAASRSAEMEPALAGAAVGAASPEGGAVAETRRARRAREAGVAAVAVPMIEEDPDIEVPMGDDSDAPVADAEPYTEAGAAAGVETGPWPDAEPAREDAEAFVPESLDEPDGADEPERTDAVQSDTEPAGASEDPDPRASHEPAGTGQDDENPDDDRDQN